MFLHLSVILFMSVGLFGGGSLSRGVSLSWGVSVRETSRTVKREQYASYWNAFFFLDSVPKKQWKDVVLIDKQMRFNCVHLKMNY